MNTKVRIRRKVIPSTISELPWQVVGTDLFTWDGNNYVLVVDYMSRFFEVARFRKLPSIYVFSYFPFGFEGRMWDLIVSVPDHCLSFYLKT